LTEPAGSVKSAPYGIRTRVDSLKGYNHWPV